MKNKIIMSMLLICMATSISACGNDKVESQKEVSVSQESGNSDTEVSEATEALNSEASESEADDSTTGTIEQGDGFTKTPVITDKALNYSGSAGPINYTIDAIQISNLVATDESAAEMFGIEKDKETAIVVMDVTAENTSDDDVSFYIGQATLVSSTKEQVDPSMLYSDYIDGDFLGQVVKSGSLVYILPNSNANDITSISLRISAPIDSDWNSLSDDISIDLNFE